MRYLVVTLLAVAALFILLAPIVGTIQNRTKVINCAISEISPDFTQEMREACRKARNAS